MSYVKVYQLNSRDNGKAYLNVEEKSGYIEVWGDCWGMPVYLCQTKGINYHLLVFDNKEYAKEYFENHPGEFFIIQELKPTDD